MAKKAAGTRKATKNPARMPTHAAKLRSKQTLSLSQRTDTYHHGSAHLSVHLAAPAGAQAALIETDPHQTIRG